MNQLQRPNRDLRHNGRDKASNLLPPPGKGYLARGSEGKRALPARPPITRILRVSNTKEITRIAPNNYCFDAEVRVITRHLTMSISSSPTFACTGHLHVHAQTYAPSIRSLTCAPIDTGQACASTHTSSAFAARRLAPPPRGLGCQAERIEVAQPPQNCSPLPHRGQARAPHLRSPENHDHFRTPAPSLYCGCTGAAGEASGESRSGSPRPANRPDHMNQLQRPNRDLRHNGRDKASNLLPPPGKGYLARGDRRSCRASQRPGSKATTMSYHEFCQSCL